MTEFHYDFARQSDSKSKSEIRNWLFSQMKSMSGQYAITVRYMKSVLANYGIELDFYFNASDRIQFRVAVCEDSKFFSLSETNSSDSTDMLTPESAMHEMPAAMSALKMMKPEVFDMLFKNFSREELVAQAVILVEGFAEQYDLLLNDIQQQENLNVRTSLIRSLHAVRRQLKAMGFKKLLPLNLIGRVSVQVEESDSAKKSSTHNRILIIA